MEDSLESSSGLVTDSKVIASTDNLIAIKIPDREHGYKSFEPTIIESPDEFEKFIAEVEEQDHWNKKDKFMAVLQRDIVDFTTHNIIIFPHTEGSGSIAVTPQEPILENHSAIIVIDRIEPPIQTEDMAYYAFAYKINKSFDKVTFFVAKKRIEILNKNPSQFNIIQD